MKRNIIFIFLICIWQLIIANDFTDEDKDKLINSWVKIDDAIGYKKEYPSASVEQIIQLFRNHISLEQVARYKKYDPLSTIDQIVYLSDELFHNFEDALRYKESDPTSTSKQIIQLSQSGFSLDLFAKYKLANKNASVEEMINLADAVRNSSSGQYVIEYKVFNPSISVDKLIAMLNNGYPFDEVALYRKLDPSVTPEQVGKLLGAGIQSAINIKRKKPEITFDEILTILKNGKIEDILDYIAVNPKVTAEEMIKLQEKVYLFSESNTVLNYEKSANDKVIDPKKISLKYSAFLSDKNNKHDYTSSESIEKISKHYIENIAKIFDKKDEEIREAYNRCEKDIIQKITLKNDKTLKKNDIFKKFKIEEIPEYDASCVATKGVPLYYGTGYNSLQQAMKKITELMAKGKEAKGNSTLLEHKDNSRRSPWNATSLDYGVANNFARGLTGTQKPHIISTTFIIDSDRMITQRIEQNDSEQEIGVYRIIPGDNFLSVVVEIEKNENDEYEHQHFINTYAEDKRKAFYLLLNNDSSLIKILFSCVVLKLGDNSRMMEEKKAR